MNIEGEVFILFSTEKKG